MTQEGCRLALEPAATSASGCSARLRLPRPNRLLRHLPASSYSPGLFPPWPVLALARSGKHKRSPLPVIEAYRLCLSSLSRLSVCLVCLVCPSVRLSVRGLQAKRHPSVLLARTCKSNLPVRGPSSEVTASLHLSRSPLRGPQSWCNAQQPRPVPALPPNAYAVPAYDAMYAAVILYACVVHRYQVEGWIHRNTTMPTAAPPPHSSLLAP